MHDFLEHINEAHMTAYSQARILSGIKAFYKFCQYEGTVKENPTRLVEAAIGGKTAVNLAAAKNSVGAFHHPSLVVCDTSLLATLERAELASGLFEVVKMAMILDAELFARVERELDSLLTGDSRALAPVVAAAVRAKIGVVEADPAEGDRRRLLNFGHTLGHALEAAGAYSALRHGEAVAYGMLFALRLAVRRGMEPGLAERLGALVGRFDLPPLPEVGAESLMLQDWFQVHMKERD